MALRRSHTRLGTRLQGQPAEGAVTCTRQLPVKISVLPDRIILRAQLPGFTADEIDVRVRDRLVIVSTNRRAEMAQEQLVTQEVDLGNWYRRVRLPRPVHPRRASVSYENGELTVDLPVGDEATLALENLPGSETFEHLEIPLRTSADIMPPGPGPHLNVYKP
jgi:HSP20 family protein